MKSRADLAFLEVAEKNRITHIAWMTNMFVLEIYIIA